MDPAIKRVLWGFLILSILAAVIVIYMVLAGQGKAPAL